MFQNAGTADFYALFLVGFTDPKKAENLGRRALKIRKNAFGEKHYLYVQSATNLAAILIDLSNFMETEELLMRSIEICPRYANSYYWLAKFHQARGVAGDREKEESAWMSYLKSEPGNHERLKECRERLKVLLNGS